MVGSGVGSGWAKTGWRSCRTAVRARAPVLVLAGCVLRLVGARLPPLLAAMVFAFQMPLARGSRLGRHARRVRLVNIRQECGQQPDQRQERADLVDAVDANVVREP